jgi:hypothetical protein
VSDKNKKRIRAIQDLTGWKYQFTLFLVRQLGADEVFQALADERRGGDPPLAAIADALNERARRAQANQRAADRPAAPSAPTDTVTPPTTPPETP